jgi:hypothetical protein
MTIFDGYMLRFDVWEKVIRASDGSDTMKEKLVAAAKPLRTNDGLLDSFQLGLTLGELSKQLTPIELEDFQRTRRPGGNLDLVPFVKSPRGGWVS